MIWGIIMLVTAAAGVLQAVIGFGSGTILMLFFPYMFGMIKGTAYSSSMTVGLCIVMAIRFRKYLNIRICLLPLAIYLFCSLITLNFIQDMNTDMLGVAFGVFLILLSIYFFVFAGKVRLKANTGTAILCSAISGTCAGLFGIGGPLMALYFVDASEDKNAYIANIQFMFSITSTSNMLMRIFKGIFTIDMVPLTAVGILVLALGGKLGFKILDRINADLMRKLIYAFIAASGVITVLKNIL